MSYVPVLRGLGLLEPTAGGLTVRSAATCLSAQERQEAQSKCAPPVNLRGLGQMPMAPRTTPMAGRLTGMDPCAALKLPACPTPKCLDATTIAMIMGCATGAPPAGVNCSDPWNQWTILALGLSALPFCQRPAQMTLPTCLTKDQLAMVFYCQRYPKYDGPDKAMNAKCWMFRHDAAFWSAYQNKLLCVTPAPTPPPPAPRPLVVLPPPAPPPPKPLVVLKPPPVVVAKPPGVVPPPPPFVAPRPPMVQPVAPPMLEPPVQKAGIGVGGLLAIAAGVAVGGWLLFGRKKKNLPGQAAA